MAYFDSAFNPYQGSPSAFTSPGLDPNLLAMIFAMQNRQGQQPQGGSPMGGMPGLPQPQMSPGNGVPPPQIQPQGQPGGGAPQGPQQGGPQGQPGQPQGGPQDPMAILRALIAQAQGPQQAGGFGRM